jgi:hypothetical protein
LDAGFSSESSGLDPDLSVVCDIDNDLFHGSFLRLLIGVCMDADWDCLSAYRGGLRRFWS